MTTPMEQLAAPAPSSVTILMPLPDHDFDPTETAIPWKACVSQGCKVVFSTETGAIPEGDTRKLSGPLPGLLSASQEARRAYPEMARDPGFRHPLPYESIDASQYAALLLPGGDGPRVRQFLDSAVLRGKVFQFHEQHKLIGAICHGMLVPARTLDPLSGRSILYGRKITALPRSLDRFGYLLDRWFIKYGYIMYSSCVADEVRAQLEHPGDLSFGPSTFKPYAVSDGDWITARWYLDAELFAQRFVEALRARLAAS